MAPSFLQYLVGVTLVVTSAQSLFLPSRLRELTDDDQCYNNSLIPLQFDQCSSSSDVFGDARFVFVEPTQCRSLCEDQSPAFLSPFHRAVNCDFCRRESDARRYVLHSGGFIHICVPRHVCIDECGEEEQGCVYTGSCGSQICFNDSNSGSPARIQRYTHRGPGTVILVENTENGTTSSTDANIPADLPLVVHRGADYCLRNGEAVGFKSSKSCSLSPLSDGRENATEQGQCRVACESFDYSPYEVVRIFTDCNFCSTSAADEWFTPGPGDEPHVCIPRQVCIDECGPEGYGCVYSGSCMSRICFSGIDSKKPAVFTALSDDGKESELSVDNNGEPVDTDPPVFGPLGKEGNATSDPPATVPPNPTPTRDPSASSSPGAPATPRPNTATAPSPSPSGSSGSIWVWLGPTIGVGVVAVMVVVSLLVLVARRNQARRAEVATPPANFPPYPPPLLHNRGTEPETHSQPSLNLPPLRTPAPSLP